jgi:hypothetical protein
VTGDPACAGPGVHQVHVSVFRCDVCHPAGATFGFDLPYTFPRGTTTAGGTLVRTAGQPTTCTVACHFPNGAAPKAVAWNTPGPLACTACHDTAGLPGTHTPMPAHATRADCQVCHVMTGHTDGTVQASGHGPAWIDPASPGFHAFSANRGLGACQACHGVDLTGGPSGRSCASCHDVGLPPGVTSWADNCVMCHGGTDNQTGAPPEATWGNGADGVRVGAHTAHVGGGSLASPVDCSLCHQKPADAFAADHIDPGPAEVAFSGLAVTGNAIPSWDRASATCTTYCHGSYSGMYTYFHYDTYYTVPYAGTVGAASWTDAAVTCDSCHGNPPANYYWHSGQHAGGNSCDLCHPGVNATGDGFISTATHLDGVIEVKPKSHFCFGCH